MKRFTATEKWSKPWFSDLPPRLKCLWLFICDAADAAGVWEPNFKLASFQIGEPVSADDLRQFGDRIQPIPGGKLRVLSFVQFQYGKLSEDCRAHIPVFRTLEKHSLSIAYPKATRSLKEEEEETEQEEETEDGESEGKVSAPGFDEFWSQFPKKKSKGAAAKAWAKLRCNSILPKILAGLRLAKASHDWTKDGGQYIPNPATWLNATGWEDDPSTWVKAPASKWEQAADADRARTCQPETPIALPTGTTSKPGDDFSDVPL